MTSGLPGSVIEVNVEPFHSNSVPEPARKHVVVVAHPTAERPWPLGLGAIDDHAVPFHASATEVGGVEPDPAGWERPTARHAVALGQEIAVMTL